MVLIMNIKLGEIDNIIPIVGLEEPPFSNKENGGECASLQNGQESP